MPTPRKADELHSLQGTKPHDRTPFTPSMLVAGRPRVPRHLQPEEKRVFRMLCKQLEQRRALTPGDGWLLQLAAELWARRDRAQAKIIEEGAITSYTRFDSNNVAHKVEKPNLHLKVVVEAEKSLVGILDRLGLSPVAGSKVKQTRPPENSAESLPEGSVGWLLLQGGSLADAAPDPVAPEEMAGGEEDEDNE